MSYDGKINRKLSLIKIKEKHKRFPDEVEYKLAYGKTKHSSFSNEEILDYINENYIKNDDIDDIIEENLLNDLITFKTFKTDRETGNRILDIIQNGISIVLSAVAMIISTSVSYLTSENISRFLIRPSVVIWIIDKMLVIFIVSMMVYIGIFMFRVGKDSISRDIKFIDNAIYTLETIKENKYRNGNWGTKSDERYEGLELTEVKEIRTYKATKNKYSPRAMYERKRR
ncbi:MAG: hypothetical protein E7D50_00730 [Finegoldia magna]|nr:hypothetical protein [Finegoldia magna]